MAYTKRPQGSSAPKQQQQFSWRDWLKDLAKSGVEAVTGGVVGGISQGISARISAKSLGRAKRDELNEAFPGTNPWEQMGAAQQAQAGQIAGNALAAETELKKLEMQVGMQDLASQRQLFWNIAEREGIDYAQQVMPNVLAAAGGAFQQSGLPGEGHLTQAEIGLKHVQKALAGADVKLRGVQTITESMRPKEIEANIAKAMSAAGLDKANTEKAMAEIAEIQAKTSLTKAQATLEWGLMKFRDVYNANRSGMSKLQAWIESGRELTAERIITILGSADGPIVLAALALGAATDSLGSEVMEGGMGKWIREKFAP